MGVIFLHYLGFLLTALFSAATALAYALYRREGNRTFLQIAVFFVMLLIVELCAQDMEINGAIFTFLNREFQVPALPTTICYCVTAVILSELLRSCCGNSGHGLTIACMVFFPLWFINMLLLKDASEFQKWLFIFPYQLFTLGASAYGIVKTRHASSSPLGRIVLRIMWITAVFSVLIVVEDSLHAWAPKYDILTRGAVTTRSAIENILQIIYAVTAIRIFSGLLANGDREADNNDVSAQAAADYARRIGLSARESDVLALLLEGKTNQEISGELNISLGTAKAHTHNIFQKSEAENRAELRAAFERFTSEENIKPGKNN